MDWLYTSSNLCQWAFWPKSHVPLSQTWSLVFFLLCTQKVQPNAILVLPPKQCSVCNSWPPSHSGEALWVLSPSVSFPWKIISLIYLPDCPPSSTALPTLTYVHILRWTSVWIMDVSVITAQGWARVSVKACLPACSKVAEARASSWKGWGFLAALGPGFTLRKEGMWTLAEKIW